MLENREITVYRVRKSAFDIKSQSGAFFIFENAVKKAIKTKCNIYDNHKNCIWNYKKYISGGKNYEQSI